MSKGSIISNQNLIIYNGMASKNYVETEWWWRIRKRNNDNDDDIAAAILTEITYRQIKKKKNLEKKWKEKQLYEYFKRQTKETAYKISWT